MRAAEHFGSAAVAAQRSRCGTTRAAYWPCGPHQRQHRLALAARRCHPALAASLLDISARSAVPSQGRAHTGPLRAALARPVAALGRVRHLDRREDPHSGATAYPSESAHRARRVDACGARIRTRRRLGLPGCIGRTSCQSVWPLRGDHGHRALRALSIKS